MKKITFLLVMLLPLIGMSQTFDFDNTDDGWNVLNGFTATNNATFMTLTTVAGDGTLKNPLFGTTAAGVDTSTNFYIGITLKNSDANGPTYMRVSYPKTSGNGRVYKSIDITAGDSDFVTYWIDLTNNNHWTGTKNDIKVHFKSAGNTNYILPTTPVSIDIDKIEFAPAPPTTEQHIYEFNTDNDTEGWEAANGTISGPTNGVLTFTPEAGKFAKIKQLTHHVDASQFSRVHITLKNLSTDDDVVRFIFNGDAANPVDVPVSTSDTDFVVYDVDLSTSPAWTGDVLVTISFRDPDYAAHPGQSSGTGDFLIDRIEFTNTVSVEDNQLGYFEVYPNPVKDFVRVNTENTIKEISIFDLTGKKIMKVNNSVNNNQNINVHNLNQGIYLIKVTDIKNNIGTQKFVKTN